MCIDGDHLVLTVQIKESSKLLSPQLTPTKFIEIIKIIQKEANIYNRWAKFIKFFWYLRCILKNKSIFSYHEEICKRKNLVEVLFLKNFVKLYLTEINKVLVIFTSSMTDMINNSNFNGLKKKNFNKALDIG